MSTERPETPAGKPRVLVDATGLGSQGPEVDSDLIELLRAAGRTRDDLVVVCRPRDAKLFKSFDLVVHRAPDRVRTERSRRLWIEWGLPKLAKSLGATVIHSPHGVFPVFTRLGRVVGLRRGLGRTDKVARILAATKVDVTVPSTSIAGDLRASSGLPANRLHVTPLGVDRERTAIPDWEAVDSVSDLYGVADWIAVLASDFDTESLSAFRDGFRQATEFSGTRPALIVLGMTEPIAVRHFSPLVDAGFDVRIVSDLVDSERSAILGGAQLTVVFDDSDDTGRALIDAMACGAAILARHTSALSEIGGSAVDFADATPAAVEIAITGLLKDADRRRELATAAVTQSHRFSWDASLAAHRVAWARAAARG